MQAKVDSVGRILIPKQLRDWWRGREIALSGHALAETYSVLTRLPGDLRLSPVDAARYDALVGLAAVEHRAVLATRDARARATYEMVGAHVVVVA